MLLGELIPEWVDYFCKLLKSTYKTEELRKVKKKYNKTKLFLHLQEKLLITHVPRQALKYFTHLYGEILIPNLYYL